MEEELWGSVRGNPVGEMMEKGERGCAAKNTKYKGIKSGKGISE